jgi:hypothetical protein
MPPTGPLQSPKIWGPVNGVPLCAIPTTDDTWLGPGAAVCGSEQFNSWVEMTVSVACAAGGSQVSAGTEYHRLTEQHANRSAVKKEPIDKIIASYIGL